MRETLKPAASGRGAPIRQFEYLVITVSPGESVPGAYQRLREHAEYGKWELERSTLYMGGERKYLMRRKVLRVERTLDIY
ncbi:hypothetical protein SAMN04489740_1464 [Arthrobacter alpinus]|uniref:Uncharacterized protein n=1 Tax=Arthrobacter alpinus TaxID=656366 RepID=A0A0U3G151_9MICC|nr:DUF5703 family protein [Arthrobacter alpinus]ALV45015.1 hypothetical protein MB46_05350 [Arthrobacter alpinus]SEE45917.1 hypothetical protein SAMN04489740_1464 [Arthrobacter alpinus]